MDNRLKMRISRMFRSSFGSCRTRNFTDVMEKAVFTPQKERGFQLIEPPSPKVRPFPSICRPKGSETSILSVKDSLPRRNVSEWPSPFFWGDLDGSSCPPTFSFYENEFGFDEKMKNSARNKKNKTKKKKNAQKKNKPRDLFPFSSSTKDSNFGGHWWYSSDEEDDETDTLFSSKSTSSDSSRSRRRHRSRRKKHGCSRVTSEKRSSEMGILPLQGKVRDTFGSSEAFE